jgi:hypothetical protein
VEKPFWGGKVIILDTEPFGQESEDCV